MKKFKTFLAESAKSDEHTVWYHGTTPEAAEGIRRNGLKTPSELGHGSVGTGHVYISTDKKEALGWGLRKARETNSKHVSLVTLKPQQKKAEFLSKHNPTVGSIEGSLPASAIHKVEHYKAKDVHRAITSGGPLPEPV